MQKSGQSMDYKVALTSQAQLDFRNITHYLLYKLKSEQATIGAVLFMGGAEWIEIYLCILFKKLKSFSHYEHQKN